MREGFEHEKVDAFVGQHGHLFAEYFRQFIGLAFKEYLSRFKDRTNGASNERIIASGFACQANGGAVDCVKLVGEAMPLKLEAVGAE